MVIFMGLLNDLFPSVDPPRKRDMEFEAVIKATATEMRLTPEDDFILRVSAIALLLCSDSYEAAPVCVQYRMAVHHSSDQSC